MKNRRRLWRAPASCALAATTAALVAACSTSSPFSNTSSSDLTFITAAGTWDLNRDNQVTCDEWRQYQTQLFKSADANRDGVLTQEEFQKVIKQDRLFETANFSYYNANGDNQLTLAEFTDKVNPAFKALDRNNDCVIASDEFVRTHQVDKGPDNADWREKQDSMRPK